VAGGRSGKGSERPPLASVRSCTDGQWRRPLRMGSIGVSGFGVCFSGFMLLHGREEIKAFLHRKWSKALDYRLKKTLWGFREKSHRRKLRVRMARRERSVVPLLWE
jgi:nuclear transport factor 2 (NTF2) superfamily protein